ncbi:TolC family protein [Flexithrix dorotheae]|uniref:TolC family protein n=1 Tax=Flexithrix dorotheae TaxID=70993 RepID=UPI00037250D4|nr:TolC family protein [Flexithrix dorotheae]
MKFQIVLTTLIFIIGIEVNGQETLTLDVCRKLAVENNAKIKIADNQLKRSEENVKSKTSDLYPSISADAGYKYLADPMTINLDGQSFSGTSHIYDVGVKISQNIYSGGRVQLNTENAKQEKNIAGSNLALTTDELLYQTELKFWKSVWSKEAFNIATQYKTLLDELVKVVGDKVETGLVSRNDLLMTEVKQNEAMLLIHKSRTMHEISLMELNRIVGNEINQDITVESDQIYGDFSLPTIEGIDNVLAERPEVSIQKDMSNIYSNNIKLAKSTYTPQILLNFRPIWGAPNTDLLDPDPIFNAAAYVTISVPLVEWGKKRHDVGMQQINYESSLLEMEDLQDQISLEVSSAFFQLEESIAGINLTESSLEKANENYELIRDRYQEGLTPIIELLDAQFNWLQAYNSVLESRWHYFSSLAEYNRVTGKI